MALNDNIHKQTEDAISTALHSVSTHLGSKNSSIRMMSVNFSSAFNTISPLQLWVWVPHSIIGYRQKVKRQQPPQPQSVHPAATWQSIQKYTFPYQQSSYGAAFLPRLRLLNSTFHTPVHSTEQSVFVFYCLSPMLNKGASTQFRFATRFVKWQIN